ncbi:MFS transporter [Actinopolymorpha pittospori]|uniref:Putative proline/betaine transporter n=1 Tax=Actinopolymorpha pittospori TaxID=648752 RepID=A0A927N7M0_9ACTN|nr:MFS transporter [Actinopolymorpha pittospori]MBE1613132.1 MHS family proline/betaine transporter-like MFS transporter [Actinopolymorpha pittospori]
MTNPSARTHNAAQPLAQLSPKVVVAGAVGSIVEYYDFALYGYVATILAAQFFASGDPTAALLNTLATFALAFVLRPLAGILFGHLGDRYGRKNALAATVLVMAVASGLIGFLPTYAAIGVGASALLVLARCVQGVAAGGELGGAASLVAEYSPNHRRGVLCATTQTGALTGALLASLLVSALNQLLGTATMADWGWRVPFLIAIPLGLVGLWIRTRLADSPHFAELERGEEQAKAPVLELFRNHRSGLAKTIGLSILLFAGYYVAYVYVNIHLQKVVGVDPRLAFWSTTLTLAVSVAATPLFGRLSDRVGRKPVFVGASVAAGILALPCFVLLNQGGAIAVASHVVLGITDSALMGVALAAFAEMFPTRVRYTGVALGFNVGAALAGGTAPYVSTWLVNTTGSALSPAYFLICTAAVTLLTALKLRETAGSALRDV